VVEIADRLGDRLVELTGCPPMVAHAAKIAWWRRWRTEAYRSVAKFVVPSAFVAGRLCDLDASEAYVDTTHLHSAGWPMLPGQPGLPSSPWERRRAGKAAPYCHAD